MIRNRLTKRPLFAQSALGLALALGVATMGFAGASPALAAEKKPAAPAGPKLKLSKEFGVASNVMLKSWIDAKAKPEVVAAQQKLNASEAVLQAATTRSAQRTAQTAFDADLAALLALVKPNIDEFNALLPKAVSNDDKFQAGSIVYDMSLFTKSPQLQRQGLTLQLDSGHVAVDKRPVYNFLIGRNAYIAKDYMPARTYLAAATSGGYHDGNADQFHAETYFAQNDAAGGLAVLKAASELAKKEGRALPTSTISRGLSVANDAIIADGVGYFGSELLRARPDAQSWQQALYALRRVGRYEKSAQLDLVRLMHRTNSYANGSDYMEFLQIGTSLALPHEVLASIESGVASGKLSRADIAVKDAQTAAQARAKLDAAQNLLGGYDRDARTPTAKTATIAGAGDSFLSYGQPAKAEEFYSLALTKPGVDTAEVLTRMGIAQYDQGKYAAAAETFAKVTGPRAPLAQFWAVQAGLKAKGTT